MSEQSKYRCNKYEDCGLADKCFHGKPHFPIRCGNCAAWCAQSIFCQGGMACQDRSNELTNERKVELLRGAHCVEVKP